MNPIENLWGTLSRRVYANNKQYENVDELKDAIETEWKGIELNMLKKLIDSMGNRIFELVKKNGSWTHY